MGAVFRAIDRRTGERVAVKVLAEKRQSHTPRFLREARLLSELDHPTIVGHRAHGVDADGRPWLAMRWLEGEDLAERLTRSRLDPESTVALGVRICEALTLLHARSVVHRDIKPENVFLEEGRTDRAVLLDLGVARQLERRTRLTSTNEVVGTVGYLAPEQIEDVDPISPASDLFALGCVLYECLTGEPAFAGPHPLVVLAKVLLVEPPPIREKHPEVPPALADLVHSLLSKAIKNRPLSAKEVRRALLDVALADIGAPAPFAVTERPPPPARIGAIELRVVTFLIVEPRPVPPDTRTRPMDEHLEEQAVADRIAAAAGARLRWSADGIAFAMIEAGETPGDRAARGARLALELAQLPWVLRVVVSTGRVECLDVLPAHPLLDRFAQKIRDKEGPEGAFLDAATEALLSGEVVVVGPANRRRIVARGASRLPRTILGRTLPCLGRTRELAVLDGAWSATLEEGRARAVVVTGPAGVGKTRLVTEWLATRAHGTSSVEVLRAAADPMQAGTLGVVGDLIRSAVLRADDEETSPRGALARHAAQLGLEDPRIVAFLGELARIDGDEAIVHAAVRAARGDPRVRADWLERAFFAWIERIAERPVIFAIEDIGWADEASVSWLGRVLRRHADRQLMVLGTSRPKLEDRLSSLGEDAPQHWISLGRLSQSASSELVAIAAGEELDAESREAVVSRANGHPFLLEELVRHAVDSGTRSLPDSVLAMVQLRLDKLGLLERRLLRLASIFGERFTEVDLASLAEAEVRSALVSLERAEVIGPEAEPGRWSFRHALVREAAYESMSADDRSRAHETVAAMLDKRGEPPEVVARHFEAAGLNEEAAAALVFAARRALERGVPAEALRLADRAAPLTEVPDVKARAWAYASGASSMIGDVGRAAKLGGDAMEALSPEREEWFMAAYGPCLASYQLDTSRVPAVTRALLSTPPASVPPTILSAYAFSACILVLYGVAATRPLAQKVVAVGREVVAAHGIEAEPFLRPLQTVLAVVSLREGDVAEGWRHAVSALGWCEAIGAQGLVDTAEVFTSLAAIEVGRGQERLDSLARARHALFVGENLQQAHFGLAVELRALAASGGRGNRASLEVEMDAPTAYHAGWYASQRATFVAETGDLEAAARMAAPLVAGQFPLFDGFARSLSARADVEAGRFEQALAHVAAFDLLSQEGQTYPLERSWIDLVRIRALRGLGRKDEAEAALDAALTRIALVSSRLDPGDRSSYESGLRPNREILELAGD